MMKKKVAAFMCVAVMAVGMTACGESKTQTPKQTESSQTQTETIAENTEETAEGATFTTDLLYNDADELVDYVPFSPTGNSYAEAMMQVTGYTYTFIPDGDTYTLNMTKKEERFEVIFRDGSSLKDEGIRQILVDKETGVNYLCWKSGYGAGITPLLDSEGKVIVTK